MDPFKDQKTLFPKDIVFIVKIILGDLERVNADDIQLTAKKIVDSNFLALRKFFFEQAKEFIEKYKKVSKQESFYIFYISCNFSRFFANTEEKRIIRCLEKLWEAVLEDKEIKEYIEKSKSLVSFDEWVEKKKKLRKKLKK